MKTTLRIAGIAALVGCIALPALAQMDAGSMTCGDFFALDDAGRAEATNAVTNFVNDSANAASAAVAAEKIAGMSAPETLQLIEQACEGLAVDTNLLSVLK